MRRAAVFITSCGLLFGSVIGVRVWAQDEKKDKAKVEAPAVLTEEQRKTFIQQVKANVAAVNLQEVTVQVLGMEYQKELSKMQQMQAVFCDTYKLDVDKVRQGRYRFDEKTGKFNEVEPKAPGQT